MGSQQRRACWVAAAVLLLTAAVLAVASDGVVQDDEVTHYLIARGAWQDWHYLLDTWGRPGCTLLYAPVSGVGGSADGFLAARLLTVVLMGVVAWLSYLAARKAGARYAAAVPVILLLMPTVFTYSFTPSTEVAAALYLTAAAVCLAYRRDIPAALILGLLPATRHELIVLMAASAIYFLRRRSYLAVLLLGWAEAVWNLMAWHSGMWLPIRRFIERQPADIYGRGHALTYLGRWVELSGIVFVLMSAVGIAVLLVHIWRRRHAFLLASSAAHQRRWLQLLIAGGSGGVLLMHTLLYMFNYYASGGYARFLIPIAPLLAIAAAFAIGPIAGCIRSLISSAAPGRQAAVRRLAGFAVACAVAGALIHWQFAARPHRLNSHQYAIAEGMKFVQQRYPGYRIVGHTPWIRFFETAAEPWGQRVGPNDWERAKPARMVYFYDMSHSTSVPLGWITGFPNKLVKEVRLPESNPAKDPPYLRVFVRQNDG